MRSRFIGGMTTDLTHDGALAQPGDWVEVRAVRDVPTRHGEILEVLGRPGHRRYRVRWDEEHESIFFPADGCHVHHPARGAPEPQHVRLDAARAEPG